jgi:hypothetical protein
MKLKTVYQHEVSIAVAFFFAGVIYLFPFLRYYVDDSDTFSYISIAEKYHNGNFSGAINSTWSPLMSVILSILMYTQSDVFLLFRLLQVALGLSALFLSYRLIQLTSINGAFRFFILLALVPSFLAFAFSDLSADLLFLNVLLLIHILVLSFNGISRKRALLLGLCGGLLYWSKAYGIYFFPVFVSAAYLWHYVKGDSNRKSILKNAGITFAVFIILSSTWIAAISIKYQRLTFTDAPAYNTWIEKLKATYAEKAYPEFTKKFINSEQNNLSFAWEDPALSIPEIFVKDNITFTDRKNILYNNILVYYYYQFRRQIGWVFISAVILALLFHWRKFVNRYILLLVFSIMVFPAGYLLLHFIGRYIFITTVLMALVITYISNVFWKNGRRALSLLLFIPLCFLLIKRPVKQLLWAKDEDKSISELFNSILHSTAVLHHTYDLDNRAFVIKDSLIKRTDLEGTVASYASGYDALRESYPRTMIQNHYLRNKYYGQLSEDMIRDSGIQHLQKNKVDFYYTWSGSPANDSMVKTMEVMFEDTIAGMRIHKVKR